MSDIIFSTKVIMSSALRTVSRQGRRSALPSLSLLSNEPSSSHSPQERYLGGGVPEFWGRKSRYTEGTDFLGTPANHLDLVQRRPISPDVFDLNGGTHYAFPITAISSIINRGTGLALSGAWTTAGILALTGDLDVVASTVAATPALCMAAKMGLSFPLVYHMVGGVRHLVWDHANLGMQIERKSVLEKDSVPTSSMGVIALSTLLSVGLAVV